MSYNVGDRVKGVVSGVAAFGAFVKLDTGGVGLIHISKLSRDFVRNVADLLQVGDEVTATVISISGDKIALSLIEESPKSVPHRDQKDFESMLSSFKSASDERLMGLSSKNRKARKRQR